MPLIILCGLPSSGKTRRAKEICEGLSARGYNVHYVAEHVELARSRLSKDSCFISSFNEKQLRAALKARVIALLDQKDTVILDSSNYIKGYRYELYCASKACNTTQCTIFTIINIEEARKFNQNREQNVFESYEIIYKKLGETEMSDKDLMKSCLDLQTTPYSEETFDALVLRFEEPNSQNRWDSPLFTLQPSDELNVDDIYKALYERKPPPPNMSTQNPPLSSTNYLYELDKVTQDIAKQILDNKKINPYSQMIFPTYPNCQLDAECVQVIQPAFLQRMRRQFLTFAKMQYSNHDPKQIGELFLQYLNTNLQKSDN